MSIQIPEIRDIAQLLKNNRMGEAEVALTSVMEKSTVETLLLNEDSVRELISKFYKKRRRGLEEKFNKVTDSGVSREKKTGKIKNIKGEFVEKTKKGLIDGLNNLSENHIFQFSSYYRDFLDNQFKSFINIYENVSKRHFCEFIKVQLGSHSKEIFTKGFKYNLARNPEDIDYPTELSFFRLQRFIELLIDIYSANISRKTESLSCAGLRDLTSAFLFGIISGFGDAEYLDKNGWSILSLNKSTWVHFLPFMNSDDGKKILSNFETNNIQQLINIMPSINAAIDELASREVDPALPVISSCSAEVHKIEISLRMFSSLPVEKYLRIHCYFTETCQSIDLIRDVIKRDVTLVVAKLCGNERTISETDEQLRNVLVETSSCDQVRQYVYRKSVDILNRSIAQISGSLSPDTPIAFNYAEEFPLHNPFVAKYFHVYRSSVRDLLKTFEQRNGVRLWCSVRRSGKTTACFDFGSVTGSAAVITQTCDSTNQSPGSGSFYKEVSEHLLNGTPIPDDFFEKSAEKAYVSQEGKSRIIFILDEYETLFERLRTSCINNPELRYLVVQPLLNQMVSFSSSNLIVLVGQRPDAHYIFMDQNQLSPYVRQDPFPLFQHKPNDESSEFRDFVGKVFSGKLNFDESFLNAVYQETSGHPFLTVKLLIDFVDWLIERKEPLKSLFLNEAKYSNYAKARLIREKIAINDNFDFFKSAISEALGDSARKNTPWLHAIYTSLKRIGEKHTGKMSCPHDDFAEIVNEINGDEDLGFTADYLISTGEQANFFIYNKRRVSPKIPLLAKIATASRKKVGW